MVKEVACRSVARWTAALQEPPVRPRAKTALPAGERLSGSHVVAIGKGVPTPPNRLRPDVFSEARPSSDRWLTRAAKAAEQVLGRLNPVNAALDAFDNRGKSGEQALFGDWGSAAGQMAIALQPCEECDVVSVLLPGNGGLLLVHVQKSPDGRGVGPGVRYGWGVPLRCVAWIRQQNGARHATHELGFDDESFPETRKDAMREPSVQRRETQVPMDKAAFDHPGTRAAWAKARRAMITRLSLATFLFVASFITLSVLQGFGIVALPGSENKDGGLLGLILALLLFVYVVFLYLYVSALRSLQRIRRVLEAHPWRRIPGAHRHPVLKDAIGVPIQLQLDAAPEAAQSDGFMSARGTVHRRRWPEAMAQGAWYAGDIEGHGVLALPGGTDLMEVEPRHRASPG